MDHHHKIILFVLFLPLISSTSFYNINEFNKSSGIFYSNMGVTKISNSKLTLLSHINLTHLHHSFTVAKYYFKASLNLCTSALNEPSKHNHVSFHCEQTLNIIRDQLNEIEDKNEILLDISGQESSLRVRRGLINGISYGLKWLFGTPSAEDAQYYSDSINVLLDDNKQTQTLLKSQIQIISSTIKNVNASIISLKQNEDELNNNIQLINKFSSNTNNYLDKLNIESTITQNILLLSSLTNRISNNYDKFINAVNLGKHGILSPQVITPRTLFDELRNYKGEFELPITPDSSNINLYYKILEIQIFVSKGLVVFAIKIPLVDKQNYNLYNLIPLPIQHENNSIYSYIQPKKPYLLLSQSKAFYTLLQDLNSCIEYREQEYLCKDISIAKRTDQIICETQLLLTHINFIPKDCEKINIKAEIETWKDIKNNNWLYVLHRPTTITFLCDDSPGHIEDVVLKNTGILRLHKSCKGYTDHFVLQSNSETIENFLNIVPNIDIKEDDCCNLNKKLNKSETISLNPIKLTNIDLNDLRYANKKLEEFDKIVTDQINKPFIITHTHWYTIALSVIGSIVFCAICINCCRWCGCFNILKKLCCFSRNPQNGESCPAIIKNYVNCSFDPETKHEYHTNSQDIVTYNRPSDSVSLNGSIEATTSQPTLRAIPMRHRVQGRRSTTPI